MKRGHIITILAILGVLMAFDQRFFSWSEFIDRPMRGFLLYFPTLFFALLALFKWNQDGLRPQAAFAAGLLGTGLFHQVVVGQSHGNPGYMFPVGHILAPFVSIFAYLAAFALVRRLFPNPEQRKEQG